MNQAFDKKIRDPKIRIVSFDIFGTTLIRKLVTPEGIFMIMEQRLLSKYALRLPKGLIESFTKNRVKAENQVRKRTKTKEIAFSKIYDQIQKKFSLSRKQRQFLEKLELEIEFKYLQSNLQIISLIDKARQAGKKIIFVSDMYLPERVIRKFVLKNKIDIENDTLYLSSKLNLIKGDSSLFEYVIRAENCQPQEILHIGDNYYADYLQPQRLGINAIWYSQVAIQKQDLQKINLTDQIIDGATRVVKLNNLQDDKDKKTLYEIGVEVAGPLLLGYVLWIINVAMGKKIKRLYFVSRDGQVLMEVANILIAALGAGLKTEYLYGSRQSWHLPAITRFSSTDLEWLLIPDPFLTITTISQRGGINLKQVLRELNKATSKDWDQNKNLSNREIHLLRRVIFQTNIPKLIEEAASKKRGLVVGYLNQVGINEKHKIGIVDLGWRGRLQFSLENILKSAGMSKDNMIGFYFGLVLPKQYKVMNQLSYFFNARKVDDFFKLGSKATGIMEIITAGDHGLVLGYRRFPTGKIEAVFSEKKNRQAIDWGLEVLRKGIFAFINQMTPDDLLYLTSHQKIYKKKLLHILSDFYFRPKKTQAKLFGKYLFSSDQAESKFHKFAPPLTLKQTLKYTFSLSRERVALTYWVQGSRVQSSKLAALVLRLPSDMLYQYLKRMKVRVYWTADKVILKMKKAIPFIVRTKIKYWVKYFFLLLVFVKEKISYLSMSHSGSVKHIVFFTYLYHFGGVERAVLALAKTLQARRRYKITLVYMTDTNESPKILRDFQRLGIFCLAIKIPGANLMDKLQQARTLYKYILQTNVTSIITTEVFSYLPAFKLIRQLNPQVKIICWLHSLSHDLANVKIVAEFKKIFSRIVVLNNYQNGFLLRHRIKNSITINNGIDNRLFGADKIDKEDAREKLNLDSKSFICIYIGRFAQDKNPLFIIKIARKFKDSNVKFILVGDGPLRTKLESDLVKMKLQKTVILYGYQTNIPLFLAASNVLIITSPFEGMPISVIEGMSMGVVPVSSNFPGYEEVFISGTHGLALPLRSGLYVNAIKKLAGDEILRSRMSQACIEQVKAKFTLDIMADNFENIINCDK